MNKQAPVKATLCNEATTTNLVNEPNKLRPTSKREQTFVRPSILHNQLITKFLNNARIIGCSTGNRATLNNAQRNISLAFPDGFGASLISGLFWQRQRVKCDSKLLLLPHFIKKKPNKPKGICLRGEEPEGQWLFSTDWSRCRCTVSMSRIMCFSSVDANQACLKDTDGLL